MKKSKQSGTFEMKETTNTDTDTDRKIESRYGIENAAVGKMVHKQKFEIHSRRKCVIGFRIRIVIAGTFI